ncbi:MAG TPA: PrsW family glutamic-type intramembrane protease [Methanoregulaceae archaeon]|nr:PrsW family glutamic-type intramembrane protease [Methanoregulaceae archaeon]
MDTGILLILAVAPAIFWLWYFYSRDKYEPEPLSWIATIYALGIAVTIPVAFIEGLTGLLVSGFLIAVVVAPIVEEYGKFFVVKNTVYGTREFDEPVDGIVYAAAAGLGFASLENVIYVFSSLETSFLFAVQTGIIRALISVPGHVLFSAMWGYALGQAHFMPWSSRKGIITRGLLMAMVFHGLFNLLLFTNLGFAVLILLVVPLMWWLITKRIHKTLEQSPYNRYRK